MRWPYVTSVCRTRATRRSSNGRGTDDRVIVSHDTDFGTLLAAQRRSTPSFILIRSADPLTTTQVAALIIDNLDVMFEDLTAGAIITFARGHLRSRRLPLR